MKEKIIHIAVCSLLLFGLSGCSRGSGDESLALQSSDPVLLELDIALPTRTDESGIPEREKVKELRLIMIDAKSGKVEYNKLFENPTPSISKSDQYRYSYSVKIESTAGTKFLYALANAESLIGNVVTETLGAELMEGLEKFELTGEIDSLNANGLIPIVSRRYEVQLGAQSSKGRAVSMQRVEIVMAYTATKFDFTFINALSSNEDVNIVGWQIDKVAKKSYLVPHMDVDAWNMLINLGGTVDDDDWVTDYTVPRNTEYGGYSQTYPQPLLLNYGETKEDLTTYCLHESRYFGEFGSATDQEYFFTLRIKPKGWDENNPPIILSGGKFPNLKSLVRGTHVVVQARLKNMPDKGDNALEVRVKTWINDEPVNGSWEEITQ